MEGRGRDRGKMTGRRLRKRGRERREGGVRMRWEE